MYIGDVHDHSPDDCEKVTEFLSQERKESVKKEVSAIVDEEFDRLEEYANEFISKVAAHRCERYLEKVLDGDDKAAKQLLGGNGDRYKMGGHDAGEPWSQLIHGKLFETRGIRMRRKIVEANAELLRNERIKDLESIVEGLTLQVNKLEREKVEWRNGG